MANAKLSQEGYFRELVLSPFFQGRKFIKYIHDVLTKKLLGILIKTKQQERQEKGKGEKNSYKSLIFVMKLLGLY